MSNFIDLTGRKINALTVLAPTGNKTKYGRAIWSCLCDCGNIAEVDSGRLLAGNKTDCGHS